MRLSRRGGRTVPGLIAAKRAVGVLDAPTHWLTGPIKSRRRSGRRGSMFDPPSLHLRKPAPVFEAAALGRPAEPPGDCTGHCGVRVGPTYRTAATSPGPDPPHRSAAVSGSGSPCRTAATSLGLGIAEHGDGAARRIQQACSSCSASARIQPLVNVSDPKPDTSNAISVKVLIIVRGMP